METKTYRKNQVIFEKGAPGGCMYEVYSGRVGVFANYGTPEQKLLNEYFPGQYFGEMGILDEVPRSATAVSLTDDTCVAPISEEGFQAFFRENPARVWMVMEQMSHNLRRRTLEYAEVCSKVKELSEKEAQA